MNKLELQSRQPSLYFAVLIPDHNRSYEIMKMLIEHGANPNFKDQYIQTVFFYACREGTTLPITQVKTSVSTCSYSITLPSMNRTGMAKHHFIISLAKTDSTSSKKSKTEVALLLFSQLQSYRPDLQPNSTLLFSKIRSPLNVQVVDSKWVRCISPGQHP